jgi:hypothetical protein
MGLLSAFKRLYKSDFPQQYQQLIDQLSYYINTNEEQLFQTLNNNVNLANNIYCIQTTLTVTVDAKGNPINSVGFNNSLATPVIGIQVLNAVANSGSNIYPTGGIFCSFTTNNSAVTVNNITGLPANQSFTLTIVAYG